MKLKVYLGKPDDSLDAKVVATDTGCALGQWMHGEGRKHSHLPEFQALLQEHARFHRAAAGVITRAKGGTNVTEDLALGGASEFGTSSSKVVALLMKLKGLVRSQ